MPPDPEHAPGDPAPATGRYRLLDIFGSPTNRREHVIEGEALPAAPRGHTWRLEREATDPE